MVSLKLFKMKDKEDQKLRDYAKYFYQKLLYKSREELSKNLYFEDIKRKDDEANKAK